MRRFFMSFFVDILSIFCRYSNHYWFGFNPTFHIVGLDLLRFLPKVGLDLLRFSFKVGLDLIPIFVNVGLDLMQFSSKVGLDLKISFIFSCLYLKILCIFVLDLKAFRFDIEERIGCCRKCHNYQNQIA